MHNSSNELQKSLVGEAATPQGHQSASSSRHSSQFRTELQEARNELTRLNSLIEGLESEQPNKISPLLADTREILSAVHALTSTLEKIQSDLLVLIPKNRSIQAITAGVAAAITSLQDLLDRNDTAIRLIQGVQEAIAKLQSHVEDLTEATGEHTPGDDMEQIQTQVDEIVSQLEVFRATIDRTSKFLDVVMPKNGLTTDGGKREPILYYGELVCKAVVNNVVALIASAIIGWLALQAKKDLQRENDAAIVRINTEYEKKLREKDWELNRLREEVQASRQKDSAK